MGELPSSAQGQPSWSKVDGVKGHPGCGVEGGYKFLIPEFSVRGAGKGELTGASSFPTSCHLRGQVAVVFFA